MGDGQVIYRFLQLQHSFNQRYPNQYFEQLKTDGTGFRHYFEHRSKPDIAIDQYLYS